MQSVIALLDAGMRCCSRTTEAYSIAVQVLCIPTDRSIVCCYFLLLCVTGISHFSFWLPVDGSEVSFFVSLKCLCILCSVEL